MPPHNPLFVIERVGHKSVSEEAHKLIGESNGPSEGEG